MRHFGLHAGLWLAVALILLPPLWVLRTSLVPESMAPDSLLQLVSTDYKFAVSFTILIIVLLFMPTGLFKGKST